MGVVCVINYTIGESRTGQQTIDMLQKRLEQLGAEKTGNFTIDCETYQSQPPAPARMVHTLHNSDQPASCFSVLDTGTTLVSDILFDVLMAKMKGFYVPRKNLKVESRGQRYTLGGDFVVKVGSVILGQATSFKGVLVEVEYMPTLVPSDCWPLMKEFIAGVLGAAYVSLGSGTNDGGVTQHFRSILDAAQSQTSADGVLQYLEHFNNFRKALTQSPQK